MRAIFALSLPLLLLGCRSDTEVDVVDADADGVPATEDCNDDDAAVFPGAIETCDGIDNDCDDHVDDEASDATEFYVDDDGDGYGDSRVTELACDAPTGFTEESGDCDDGDPAVHPGAEESDCTDDTDYNCDGSTGFADSDADGHPACEDCDDTKASINPDAVEICDDADNDCDGDTDEQGAAGESAWYADADGDTYGTDLDRVTACDKPEGYVSNDRDCNDTSAEAHPGAEEVCDGLDNDCNGKTDEEGATGSKTFYADADDDGYGNVAVSQKACEAPEGYVEDRKDCDDGAEAVNPGATELCNDVDDDCDDEIDEGFDEDADGWTTCEGDCADDEGDIHPAASEVCNGVDDDCDDEADEDDALDATTFYVDDDGDGFGDVATAKACARPDGYAANDDDCDDGDAAVSPIADEVCNGIDDNCDGDVDDRDADLVDPITFYVDADGDGHGNERYTKEACEAPDGYADSADDCDDGDDTTYPEAPEVCDDVDHDCDGDLGLSQCADCAAILDADPSAGDGVYAIDLDGEGGADPFDVWCDMTVDGGGWTRWWWFEAGSSMGVSDVLGGETWECDPSSDTTCFAAIPVADPAEMLVLNGEDNWAVWEFDPAVNTSQRALAAFYSRTPVNACGTGWTPVAQGGTMTDNPYHCDENNNAGNDYCDCFWYQKRNNLWSFYLDDDTGWAETAFAAGYDNGNALGVDSLELQYRPNTTSQSLYLHWR